MLEIVRQTNSNDCGICVLKSLIKYHHKKEIDQDELLNNSNINKSGMSIYDLEILANQYGLNLESYECNTDEIFELSKKEYFVVLLKSNDLLHYVICKLKDKKVIKIFCSINGEYELTKSDFDKQFSGFYLKVNKSEFNDEKIINENKVKLDCFNWKYLVLINTLNILFVFISVFGSLFTKKIIDLVIVNDLANNLLFIIITFGLNYLLEVILEVSIDLFTKKRTFNFYHHLHNKTLLKLTNKKQSFFNKVDYNHLINFDEYLYQISSYYNVHLNKFISDIVFSFVVFIFLAMINNSFIWVALISLFINIVIESIKTKIAKNQITKVKEVDNEYSNNVINFINTIKNSKNVEFNHKKTKSIKNSFIKNKDIAYNIHVTDASITVGSSIAKILIYLLLVTISSKLVLKNVINIGSFTLVLSLFQMFNSNIKSLFKIYLMKPTIDFYKVIISNIWNVSNNEYQKGYDVINLQTIFHNYLCFYNDSLLSGPNGIGKSTVLRQIADYQEGGNVKFNNVVTKDFLSTKFKNNILYLTDDYLYDENDLISVLSSENYHHVLDLIQSMNIMCWDPSQLSLGQKQILNFISLLNYKNKIILLDEFLNHVDQNTKHFLLTKIKPLIVENNFLIMVDHDIKNYSDYFRWEAVMNEKIY